MLGAPIYTIHKMMILDKPLIEEMILRAHKIQTYKFDFSTGDTCTSPIVTAYTLAQKVCKGVSL